MTEYEKITGDDDTLGGAPLGLRPIEELSEDERAKLEARGARFGLSVEEVRFADRDGFDLGYYKSMKGVRNRDDFQRLQDEREADQRARADADHQRRVAAHVKSPREAA